MTRHARLVLEGCQRALEGLRRDPTDYEWLDGWFTAVGRLRQVGYVLEKVDGKSDPAMKQAAAEAWARPKPPIFLHFIEAERNRVVKENRSAARHSVTVRPGAAILDAKSRKQVGTSPSGPTTFEYVMAEGPFAGRDPRAVYEEAVRWWKAYLDAVDQRAAALRN